MTWIKAPATKLDDLSLTPQDFHGGREDPIIPSYPLTSTHVLWHIWALVQAHACMHTYLVNYKNIKNILNM